MKAPRLDRRITIQTPVATLASDGSAVNSWTDLATVYAQKRDVPPARTSGERFSGQQFTDSLLTEFTIRYYSGITGVERISYDGAYYNLVGIPAEVERQQYLIITCQRGMVK